MYYVIQTLTGKEADVSAVINLYVDGTLFKRCFVPLYEDVWRSGGTGHIGIKRMFAGYVFIETDRPVELYQALRTFPRLTIILYNAGEEEKTFLPLYPEEEEFFENVLHDGIMRVSYVHSDQKGRLDTVIGPLHDYTDHILKVDIPHRRAIAQIPFLGEERSVKFGLWTDKDEKIDWIEEAKKEPDKYRVKPAMQTSREKAPKKAKTVISGYKPGDKVICTRGLYGDTPLEIAEVREKKGTVVLKVPMFGSVTKVEMSMEDIISAN